MSEFDLDSLLEPVSATDPSGKNPAYEYVSDFQKLLDAARGQPEQVMGDSVNPAVSPDWKRVMALGRDMLSRGKDIHTAILICRALLHIEGFSGLASGMTLIRRLLAEYWDGVHPRLDAEDDNDPTERMNALGDLCDRDAMLAPVRTTPLIQSRAVGAVSLRDIRIAKDEASGPVDTERAPLDQASIEAAFLDCEIERLQEAGVAVASAVGDLGEIERIVTDRVGVSRTPDLGPLRDLLSHADSVLRTKIAERTGNAGSEATASADNGVPAAAASNLGDEPATPGARSNPASIADREDVVRMLDRICDYYARNEPSSPVPLLLQRARRLVAKDFLDIVQDLAPDALAQIEMIRGPENNENND